MIDNDMNSPDINVLEKIEKRLKRVVNLRRLISGLAGLLAVSTLSLGLFLLLASLSAIFILPALVKIPLMLCGLSLILWSVYRYIIAPVKKESGLIQAALRVEKKYPQLKNRLVAALQFKNLNLDKTNFSHALVAMTGRQAAEIASGINFNETISGYPVYKKIRYTFATALLVILVGYLIPGMFSSAIEVYSNPTETIAPPPQFSIHPHPSSGDRVKYTDIKIGGDLLGFGFPEKAEIYYRFTDGRWQSEKIDINKSARYSLIDEDGQTFDSLPFGINLKQVRRSFDYYITAGDIKSQTVSINIVERPRVVSIKASITYPAYTGLKPMVLDENNGSLAALVGSRVNLEIGANRAIDRGYLVIDSSKMNVEFDGSYGSADFKVVEDFSYFIRLYDNHGEQNPDPIEYMVTAVPDEYPNITVLYPGFDLNLDETMLIPFRLQVADDFGFSSLLLKYQVISGGIKGSENVAVINFSDAIRTEGEVSFNWDLENFYLLPSDYVLYHFELADNDRVSGPKVTSSRTYVARLPSIDEIVMQSEAAQQGQVNEAEKILREQREMAQKMKEMARQMRSAENQDWQKKKEMENLLNRQQVTADQLDEMARKMEESIEKMANNDLLNEQILQKMMELQKLFSEIATDEMKEAMKKLAEALKEMSPDELEKAMDEFQMNQQEMLKKLERSVELLKRMQIEQKMAAMLKIAEEMLLEQNRVNVETEEKNAAQRKDRLTEREKRVDKQNKTLGNEAKKLMELLPDSPFAESADHEEFAQTTEEFNPAEEIQNTMSQLQQGAMQKAGEKGRQSSEKLSNMVEKMQGLMAQMSQQEGAQIAKDMRQAINDANLISQEQEAIHGKSDAKNYRRQSLSELASQQKLLREAVGGLQQKVDKLSRQSPFMAAEVRTLLEDAKKEMSRSCDNLGGSRPTSSAGSQLKAMYNLNQSSLQLLEGLKNQKECNKGGACNKPSQSMQSMSRKQSQINQETQKQCSKPGEKMSQSQKDGLKRLAAEQGSLRKSMMEMQEEFGNRRDLLGRLDAVANEMKAIEEMLEDGQTGDDLQQKQLQVYSRMLDMQKSLNRRDFSRERQAISAEEILRNSPGMLDQSGFNRTETLQDKLNRYLQNGYPRQYEKQIKAYFKAISGSENNEN